MATRFDPILGKLVEVDPTVKELELLIEGKAALDHTHSVGQVQGLSNTLDGMETKIETLENIVNELREGEQERHTHEKVALKLSTPIAIDFSQYRVNIQDTTGETSLDLYLSATGECSFEIPIGHRYTITLPLIDGYNQPSPITYTATLNSRNIDYGYANQSENLVIRIAVRSTLDGNDASIFNGLEVIATGNDGVNYNGFIENAQVAISIPYGITYTIHMPEFAGLTHNHTNETYTAGLPSRTLVYSYMDYHNISVYGIDAQGNTYTTADLLAMGTEAAAALIVAGAYNNPTLANAQRKDGSIGCGFCWSIASPTVSSTPWAQANVDFGVNNTIVADAIASGALTEACGYYSNHALAYAVKDGAGESALVKQVGRVLADAGKLNQANPTPAFKAAEDKKLTIAGVERSGFLLSFGQLYDLYQNKADMDAFYAALGKTAPAIHSGLWWTACQYNAANAVHLNGGSFNGFSKTNNNLVLVGFDL